MYHSTKLMPSSHFGEDNNFDMDKYFHHQWSLVDVFVHNRVQIFSAMNPELSYVTGLKFD